MYCFYILFGFGLLMPNFHESHTWIVGFWFQKGTQSPWTWYFRSLGSLYKKRAPWRSRLGQVGEVSTFPGQLNWELWLSHRINRSSCIHQDMLGRERVRPPAEPGNCFRHIPPLGLLKGEGSQKTSQGLQEFMVWGWAHFFLRQIALVQAICVPLWDLDYVFQP